ncbi:MAG: ribosomal-processing cysteine protease Prp [Ruminococcaceae bacterium]|nr:ribosomal-processing cysteine protease Prp [Oscillospiraceae bacterium]
MTNITFEDRGGTSFFECAGHTGYAPLGKDILCSAVSVLCYTLDAYLSRLHSEGRLIGYESFFDNGYVRIEFIFQSFKDNAKELEGIGAILGGFLILEESFPDHIRTNL